MFEKASAPAQSETPSDVVIHTMPREFYGKEASVTESAAPKVVAPKVVVPPPPVQPVVIPPPMAVAPLPPRKSRAWIGYLLVTLVFLGILGVGGYFAYIRVSAAQEQQRIAELAAQEAEEERKQLEREQEEDRARAAQQAAAAALEPTPGKDTDSDGLTDIEELLYGTDQRDPDSDKDTFLDGNEVFHRYHPLGEAPATLLDTGAVRELEEPTYPYTLYYPSTWSVALQRDDFNVTFKSARQASITVTWSEKGSGQTLAQWITAEKSGVKPESLKETMTKLGYYGLVSEDDRTAYLDIGDEVVTMEYDLGEKNQIEYLQTFQMMVNSLEYLDVAP